MGLKNTKNKTERFIFSVSKHKSKRIFDQNRVSSHMIFTQTLELHFQMSQASEQQQYGKGDYTFRGSRRKYGTELTAFQRRLIFMFQGVVEKCLNFSEVSELAAFGVRLNG